MAPTLPEAVSSSATFQLEQLHRLVRQRTTKALEEYGLTLRDFWVLCVVCEHSGIAQRDIATLVGADPSEITFCIDRLEERDWVRRRQDPEDRRRHQVTSSKSGRAACEELGLMVAYAEQEALNVRPKRLNQLAKLANEALGI